MGTHADCACSAALDLVWIAQFPVPHSDWGDADGKMNLREFETGLIGK